MYLDTGTFIAVLIALVSQMIMIGILFRENYMLKQTYRNLIRIRKIEREARR